MGWWPFGKKKEAEEPPTLDVAPELKSYYDNVISDDNSREDNKFDTESHQRIDSLNTMNRFSGNRTQKTLKQIALDNCIEYERAYSKCLVRGTYWERFTSCQHELTMYDKCKDMQTKALTVLGYERATTDPERKQIKMKADDLMLEAAPNLTITENQDARFNDLLKTEEAKMKINK